MNFRAYTPLLLVIVVVVAALGMPFMLAAPMHHDMGCPFMPGQQAICPAGVLFHMKQWQTTYATILAELLILVALAFAAVREWTTAVQRGRDLSRSTIRSHVPDRPTLLQVLFSNGTLNPKVF